MYLLDTNVVSALRRRSSANANVWRWAESVDTARQSISAITILELEKGVLLADRKDQAKAKIFRAWLDQQVVPGFRGRIIAIDETIAKRCAALHVPDPMSDMDSLIAATALSRDLTLVTRNVMDFSRARVRVLNPWSAHS